LIKGLERFYGCYITSSSAGETFSCVLLIDWAIMFVELPLNRGLQCVIDPEKVSPTLFKAQKPKNFKMKLFTLSATFAILALVGAAPTPTENGNVQRANIVKRATITDVADSGYATQNGG
jgi:hypothetical protein